METKDVVFFTIAIALQLIFINSLLSLGEWFLDKTLGPIDPDKKD
jgi:hypothetical protein